MSVRAHASASEYMYANTCISIRKVNIASANSFPLTRPICISFTILFVRARIYTCTTTCMCVRMQTFLHPQSPLQMLKCSALLRMCFKHSLRPKFVVFRIARPHPSRILSPRSCEQHSSASWRVRPKIWGFPKIRGTILGVPIITTIV